MTYLSEEVWKPKVIRDVRHSWLYTRVVGYTWEGYVNWDRSTLSKGDNYI